MNQATINGQYKIWQKLSESSQSDTFVVEDILTTPHPKYFLRKLKLRSKDPQNLESARRYFKLEAKILHQLGKHPTIPTIIRAFEENYEFYLVQEFIEGKTLQQEFDEGRIFKEAEVFYILEQLLEILSFTHSKNVIHKKLKPEHIIRRQLDGKIVLVGFGAVRENKNQISPEEKETLNANFAIDSNGYMADEQVAGNPKYSSDLYSIGMIAIEMLTKIHPTCLQQNQQTGEWIWLNRVSIRDEFAGFIKRMVFKDYRKRFDSAVQALNELNKIRLFYKGVHLETWKNSDLQKKIKVKNSLKQNTPNKPISQQESNQDKTEISFSPQASFINPSQSRQNQNTNKVSSIDKFENISLSGTGTPIIRNFLIILAVLVFIPATIIILNSQFQALNTQESPSIAKNIEEPGFWSWFFEPGEDSIEGKRRNNIEEKYNKYNELNPMVDPNVKYVNGRKVNYRKPSQDFIDKQALVFLTKAREAKKEALLREKNANSYSDWKIVSSKFSNAQQLYSEVFSNSSYYAEAQKGYNFCAQKSKNAIYKAGRSQIIKKK